MTFAGIFPPMCDPDDGHLLIDGCYINNVPADVMKRRGAKYILAIDVGSQDDTDLTNYGDDLSGWWLLLKRLPFTSPVKVPNLPDIQSRLAYVSCVRQLEEVKSSDYCEYIRPAIDKYTTLQFSSFDEIKDVGYNHGKTFFAGMMKGGAYPPYLRSPDILTAKIESRKPLNTQATSYSFTDLAQMVCKVQRRPYLIESDSSDEDDYEADEEDTQEVGGYASEPSANILDRSHSTMRRTGGSLSLSENELESETEYFSRKS